MNGKKRSILMLLGIIMLTALTMMAGCSGSNGTNGANGADLTTGTVDAKSFTFDDLRNIPLGGKVLSASTSDNQPVVTFQVYNSNTREGIRGLGSFALHVAQLKPEVSGSNSYWQNYILTGSSAAGPFRPGADPASSFNSSTGAVITQGYSVVDHNDGTYTVTFGTNIKSGSAKDFSADSSNRSPFVSAATVTYDASLPHRIVVGVRSVAVPGVVGLTPGAYAGPINPITGATFAQFTNTNGVNLIIDFVPATGEVLATPSRDIVTIDACNQCHYKIQYGSNNTSGHFGSRTDTKTCVMCHTPQNIVSGQTATTNADLTPFIHKIHMGEELPVAETQVGVVLNDITYPQDVKNCTMCHKGALSDNWETKPTRKACGSCHNNVDFANGINHSTQGSDSGCYGCHGPLASYPVAQYHVPVSRNTDTTSSSYNVAYANNDFLPTGAYKIAYVISSVTVSADRTASVTFQVKQNDTAVNFGTYNVSTNANLIPNTTGGPTIAFVYNQTQDGITNPADFNGRMSVTLGPGNPTVSSAGVFTAPTATATLWGNLGTLDVFSSSTGTSSWTLSGPDASNKYTVRCTTPLPASATMVTAAIYGTFTQTNLAAPYLYAAASVSDFTNYTGTSWRITNPGLVLAPAVQTKAYTDSATGFAARRKIVDNAKCNKCHAQLGVKPIFHSAARNDGTMCNICHTPNGTNSGWSYSFNTFVHGIHGSAKRTVDYTFAGDWSTVTYPGLLKNCEQCHASGTYDFTASASSGAVSNLLYNTVAAATTRNITTPSPYVASLVAGDPKLTALGSGFLYTTTTGTTAEAAVTTLVTSPITSACFSCHDSSAATAHMTSDAAGGSIYEVRSTALGKTEICLVCHGPAANTAYGDFVPAIKSVHRWW